MRGGFGAVRSECRTSQRGSDATRRGQKERLAAIECDAIFRI
jgi:hypothetical protein